jgi:uncharacterized cupredoxin-like copper-binding protein
MRTFLKGISLAAVLATLLAACGGAGPPAPTATPTLDPDNPVITIGLGEYHFTPDRIELTVGQHVTFHVVNHGAIDHEIMIGRNPLRAEDGTLGDGFEHDFFALASPTVEGDATVMGMPGMEMSDGMDMGDEGMDTGGDSGEMAMDATPTAEMAMGGEEMEGMNGGMVMFEPAQEATITFDVTEDMLGTWTMGCFELSSGKVHFDEGMVGVLTVFPQED